MRHTPASRKAQSGAALVVGMLLLLVLTLLSVSAMNTASLELVMAGNIQSQEKTFQMAEQAIDMTIASPKFYFKSMDTPETYTGQSSACGGGTISTGDSNSCETYEVVITDLDPGGSIPITNEGNSFDNTREFHFQIASAAETEAGNAVTTHTQTIGTLGAASEGG